MTGRGTEDGSVLLALVKSVGLFAAVAAANVGRRFAATLAGATDASYAASRMTRAMSAALGDVYASLIVGCVYLMAGLVTLLVVQFRRR